MVAAIDGLFADWLSRREVSTGMSESTRRRGGNCVGDGIASSFGVVSVTREMTVEEFMVRKTGDFGRQIGSSPLLTRG